MKNLSLAIIATALAFCACKSKKIQTQQPAPSDDIYLNTTAFTPNGDGKDDVACFISSTQNIKGKISVYNRWGEEIWTTTDLNTCWDGVITKTHQEAPSGVYFLVIEVEGKESKRGQITLLR